MTAENSPMAGDVSDAEIKAFREKYREIFPGSHPDRQTIIELLTASKQAVEAASAAFRETLAASPPAPSSGALKLDADELDTIEYIAEHHETLNRITPYEVKELVRVYRASLAQPAVAERAVAVKATAQCATEGCDRPATCEFSRKGVGSYYCGECFGKIIEALDRPAPVQQAGVESELVERLDEKGLKYGLDLIAEAIEAQFGERPETYDEDVDDAAPHFAWEAFASLSQLHTRLAEVRADAIGKFTQGILHGDADHREWLLAAAGAFLAGNPLPPPNGLGRAEAAEAKLAEALDVVRLAEQEISSTLDRHFALWSSPFNNDLRAAIYPVQQALRSFTSSIGGKGNG